MLRTRLILFAGIVLLVFGMYQLPKVVVDSSDEALTTTPGTAAPSSSAPEDVHTNLLSDEVVSELMGITELVNSDEVPEKRAIFADSLAEMYFSLQKFDSSAKYFDLLVSLDSTLKNVEKAGNANYEAFTFAMDQQSANRFGESARKRFEVILSLDETRLDLKNKVAMTYVSSTNPMQGIQMLNQILQQDESNEDALFNLGILAVQTGQYDRAIQRFEKLKEVNPNNLQGRFYLGLSYKETGKKDEAITELESVKSESDDEELDAVIDSVLEELN